MSTVVERPLREQAASVAEGNKGYMSGFGNGFETEALPGALPVGRNSPAAMRLWPLCRAALRLAFHRAARQQRAVLALPHPSDGEALGPFREGRCRAVAHRAVPRIRNADRAAALGPDADPEGELTFSQGMHTITTAGDAGAQAGMAAHVYLITQSMVDEYFYNADGEMMFVPQQGELRLAPNSASSTSSPARSRSFRAA